MDASNDAVLWKMSTDLFPLVSGAEIRKCIDAKYDYKQHPSGESYPYFCGHINRSDYKPLGKDVAIPGVTLHYCHSEVRYHRDPGYAQYTYLLIIRNRRYMIVGENRPTEFEADPLGSIVALDTYKFHALYHRRNPLSERLVVDDREKPLTTWAALMVEIWPKLGCDQAYEMFKNILTHKDYDLIRSR